jgi:hypothetical protein
VLLMSEGYAQAEVDRAIAEAVKHGFLAQPDADHLDIVPDRRAQARRYLLLDIAAIQGKSLSKAESSLAGYVLVPGQGPFHGSKADELYAAAMKAVPSLNADWTKFDDYRADLEWLAQRGYAISNR